MEARAAVAAAAVDAADAVRKAKSQEPLKPPMTSRKWISKIPMMCYLMPYHRNPTESETYDKPAIADTETDSRSQPPAIQRTAPIVVSAIPVSTAESDFTDLGTATQAQVVDPMQTLAESDSTSTAEPFTAKTMAIPEVVTAEDSVPEPAAQPVQPAQAEFIKPKPKQTGYVPVAPPSFSMPNTPNTGFDFTVRISPESKED